MDFFTEHVSQYFLSLVNIPLLRCIVQDNCGIGAACPPTGRRVLDGETCSLHPAPTSTYLFAMVADKKNNCLPGQVISGNELGIRDICRLCPPSHRVQLVSLGSEAGMPCQAGFKPGIDFPRPAATLSCTSEEEIIGIGIGGRGQSVAVNGTVMETIQNKPGVEPVSGTAWHHVDQNDYETQDINRTNVCKFRFHFLSYLLFPISNYRFLE